MWHLRALLTFSIAGCILAQTPALAKLDLVPFDQLLREASLIVVARSNESMVDEAGRGRAVLTIRQVVRGQYSSPTITIEWPGHEDDNGIREAGREYLLFLRKGANQYDAAIHGVSYWLVTNALDGRAVEYSYPTNMVVVPEQLISRIAPPVGGPRGQITSCHMEIIFLDRLIRWIHAQRAEPANNRLKLPARGRSVADVRLSTRAAA